jgi:hypothetical protein
MICPHGRAIGLAWHQGMRRYRHLSPAGLMAEDCPLLDCLDVTTSELAAAFLTRYAAAPGRDEDQLRAAYAAYLHSADLRLDYLERLQGLDRPRFTAAFEPVALALRSRHQAALDGLILQELYFICVGLTGRLNQTNPLVTSSVLYALLGQIGQERVLRQDSPATRDHARYLESCQGRHRASLSLPESWLSGPAGGPPGLP